MIRAVVFDLDDTLFPQSEWLAGAWCAVAAASALPDPSPLHNALVAIAVDGSDQGRIIDRALERIARPDIAVEPLVAAFGAHAPEALTPYPGAVRAVSAIRRRVPVGLVSDGVPSIQRAKLAALALADAFDVIVLSDEIGRSFRKPHPAPFLAAATQLGADPAECVMVGDRPDKDVRGARASGFLGAVRVLTGEYAARPDEDGNLVSLPDVVAACDWIIGALSAQER